jgi:hypothetical protein
MGAIVELIWGMMGAWPGAGVGGGTAAGVGGTVGAFVAADTVAAEERIWFLTFSGSEAGMGVPERFKRIKYMPTANSGKERPGLRQTLHKFL